MAKKKEQSQPDPKVKDSGFQKMIQSAKQDRARLVFDKKIVNK
jgi:hypothetical protein